MNMQTGRQGRRAAARGFTLVELMVGLVLGLIVLTALVTLFVDMSRSNREMAKTNSQIENARFAMQILEDEIVHAGYWGDFVPQFDDLSRGESQPAPDDVPDAMPDPCTDASTWTGQDISNLIGIPIQVSDTPSAGCSALVSNQQTDTDILVVRHAEVCVPGETNCEADVSGKLYFQPSFCELQIDDEQFYALGTSGFTMRKRDCEGTAGSPPTITAGTIAAKRKFVSSLFYVRDYAVTVGDGIPTLVRSQYDLSGGSLDHLPAVPLIEGIEGFRVEIGVDNLSETGAAVDYTASVDWDNPDDWVTPLNRGDGSPDEFCDSSDCDEADLMNAVVARVYILARADSPTPGYTDDKTHVLGGQTLGPFNDGYKRHVFSTTVRLVNVSGRRETP